MDEAAPSLQRAETCQTAQSELERQDEGPLTELRTANERLEGESSERQRAETSLASLLTLSRVLATSRDMDAAQTQTVQAAVEIVPAADTCTIQWLDDDNQTLHTVASSDREGRSRAIPLSQVMPGLAGHALASGQILNVPDVLRDERFVNLDASLRIRSLLVAPLVIEDRAVGTLSLTGQRVNAFASTDETIVGLVADLFAATQKRASDFAARREAERKLRRSAQQLKILREIDQTVLAAHSPETIALAAIDRIGHLIPCHRAKVLACQERDRTSLLASRTSATIGTVDASLYHEVCRGPTLGQGGILGAVDLAELPEPSPLHQALLAAGVRSYILVPLLRQEELVGALSLESTQPRAFSAEHISIATEVTASLAVAIYQVRLHALVQQQKELLENTIEALAHPFFVVNVEDYTLEMANTATQNLVVGDAEGLTCHAICHRLDWPCNGTDGPCPLRKVVQTKTPVTMEHIHYDANGNSYWVEVHGHPLFDGEGNVTSLIAYSLDVTERKQAERAAREAAAASERARLARNLHDEVSQTLYSAHMVAKVLARLWDHDPAEARRNLAKLSHLIRAASADMRSLLLELRPTTLIENDLGYLLDHLSQVMTDRTGIPVNATMHGYCEPALEVKTSLYRIAQEALNNIAKHAQASHVDLSLRSDEGRIELSISDDGHGFDLDTIPPGHLGVGIMYERAAEVGAQLAIESAPEKGTQVRVVWEEDRYE
jgi:signal transduction histidine kinase